MDYSISLNGIFASERALELSARRIARPDPAADYAAEMIAVRQAKVAAQANLRVVSTQQELENSLLDLFA